MQVQAALQDRETRIASHIVETLRHQFDMIDDEPPTVLEAVLEYGKDLQRIDKAAPKPRRELREAWIKYVEYALGEARKQENRLYYGITGRTAPAHEDEEI
jgi:hypothetical protein